MRDPRLTGVPDPLLSPLLERLAMLETAKDGLEYQLSDRNFTAEMQNSQLRQRLEQAQAEIARQQEALDNFCAEILAALQARDAAQATAEESLKIRAAALAERDRAQGEIDALRPQADEDHRGRAKAEMEAAGLLRDRQALYEKIEQETRAKETLATDLAAAEAKLQAERIHANEKLVSELAAAEAKLQTERGHANEKLAATEAKLQTERDRAQGEIDALRPQAEEDHLGRARAEMEAAGLLRDRQALLERIEKQTRANETLASDLAATEAKLQAEREKLTSALAEAKAKLQAERNRARGEIDALRAQAEEDHRARTKAETEAAGLRGDREALLKQIEQIMRASEKLAAELAAAQAALQAERNRARGEIDALRPKAEEDHRARTKAEMEAAELRGDREALLEKLKQSARAGESPTPAPEPARADIKPDPVWDTVLPALRGPVSSAFARLRQLPLGAIPEGPRAMIRLAAASLTQTSDMLKALEEYFDDNAPPAAAGRADVPIEAALAAWEGPFGQRRIKIVRRVESGLPQVLVRDQSLRVAVFEVLRNTYEALPAGGTLTVQLARDAASGGITVRFTDSGRGFSPSALLTLFAPFACARPGHLGLGLSLAQKILRRCGGDVAAANGPAKGAVVTFRLAPSPAPAPI